MIYSEIFYLVYFSQLILISIIIPFWVNKRVSNMTQKFPPEDYPKLYPASVDTIHYAMRTFKLLNLMMMGIGLVVICYSLATGAEELLNWDTQSMLTVTFLLQILPFVYLSLSGIKNHQMMRQVHQSTQRKANLAPRNMLDYVPLNLLIATAVTFIAYTSVVIYVQQDPFPGFVGYWNILFVLITNAFYFFMIHRIVSGKKLDPHQSDEDRKIHTSLLTKLLVIAAILCNLFLALNLVLSALDLRHIGDIVQSLYFQLVALVMSQTTTYKPNDYEVYRTESHTTESTPVKTG